MGLNIEETVSTLDPAFSPDGAIVTVLTGKAKGASARVPGELGAELVVGKAEDCGLVVPDDTVSRRHLAFQRVEGGIEVRDLGSTNGLKIGGARVQVALVAPGTIVRAGDIELLVRVELAGVQVPVSESSKFGRALGTSLAMRRIFGLLERVARSSATVLLTGETGTGKDVLAHALHEQGPRARGPFEVVDCGAVSPNLVESELFGHERGAFTGAVATRAGAFERAHNGTLFLDELGELPLDLQPKLLRALESREVRRVGGSKPIGVDVRVVAATTRDLPRAVRKGEFREDLWFRLAVVPVHVPPLRERLDDLPLLIGRMLENEPDLRVSEATIAALRAHDWPGNVRELRNVIERAAVMARASGDPEIRLYEALSDPAAPDLDPEDVFRFRAGTTWREAKARVDALLERRYLSWLLERHGNNASAAAREAELDRKYLAELARKHGLLSRR